jgi:RNA polymerase sigma-70 factor (ECF subfamily)
MLTVSYRITNDLQESEDILQESFLQSFSRIGQLKAPKRYGHWLSRIVVNNSLKSRRKKLRFEVLDDLPDSATEMGNGWYRQLPPAVVGQAIQELPEGARTVFTLYLMEGYKHQEVAETLGINLSTSKSQYRYALKLLKKNLSHHHNRLEAESNG